MKVLVRFERGREYSQFKSIDKKGLISSSCRIDNRSITFEMMNKAVL